MVEGKVEFETLTTGLSREGLRAIRDAVRGTYTAARRAESGLDVQAPPLAFGFSMRVTQADVDAGRAETEDIGKRWFVAGYSRPGGPDVVPLA